MQQHLRPLFAIVFGVVLGANLAGGATISGGSGHSLFVRTDGTAWACGANADGEIGDGTNINRKLPVQVMSGVQSVAAGEYHSLFLKNDGTVWAAGFNYSRQLGDGTTTSRATPVQVMNGVKAIAARGDHSLFLKTDGSAWETAAGNNSPVQVLSGVQAIAAGYSHSLFLKTDGSVWARGNNNKGQLGDGTQLSRTSAVQVMSGVKAIAAGWQHSLFLKMDGSVWACGIPYADPGADGLRAAVMLPWQVTANAVAIADGDYHSLIIKADGTAWTVGSNGQGRLGDGTNVTRAAPVQVMSGVIEVAGGWQHSLFRKSDGTVWAAGSNGYYQLGDGTPTPRSLPVQVFTAGASSGGTAPVITIPPVSISRSVGEAAAFSVAASGAAPLSYQWYKGGQSISGATAALYTIGNVLVSDAGSYTVAVANSVGNITSLAASLSVTTSGAEKIIPAISAGAAHSLFLKSDGTAWLVGNQLGVAIQSARQVMTGVKAISAGWLYSLFLKTDGTVWAFGSNNAGAFSNGSSRQDLSTPVLVMSGVKAISAGRAHALFLKADGTAWASGLNDSGQLGDGTTTDRLVAVQVMTGVQAISAGDFHSLFLKTDGTAWGAGLNNANSFGLSPWSSQPTPVFLMSGVRAIAAGGGHNLFLKTDATVWASGLNEHGQLGDGTVLNRSSPVSVMSNVLAISAGFGHSLFLKNDGVAWAAGWNSFGQLGNGTLVDRAVPVQVMTGVQAVSAGSATDYVPVGSHSLFLKVNGGVWAVGGNGWSQLGDGSKANRSVTTEVFSTGFVGVGIDTQPSPQIVALGASAEFSVSASAPGSLVYQWILNGIAIPGATAAFYSISNVQAADAGEYTVEVASDGTSVTSLPAALTLLAPLDFSPLVGNVAAIISPGAPGPIASLDSIGQFVTIVAGGKDTPMGKPTEMFVGAREFGSGRVVAVGHDGLVNASSSLDNAQFLRNVVFWLRAGRVGNVLVSNGHSETAVYPLPVLSLAIASDGFTVAQAGGALSSTTLSDAAVLVIGNALGEFTPDEITAVRNFVANGGGVLLVGLGWSWEPYHPGRTLADYPMNVLGREFGVAWLPGVISNGGDVIDGSPVFRDFYVQPPAAVAPTIVQQPSAQVATVGGSVTFTVAANGEPLPVYQWRKDDVLIVGATNSSYIMPSTALNDAGSYTVVVSNPNGTITSDAATLHLIPAGFDVAGYLARYPDIAALFGSDHYAGWLYYRNQGVYQGEVFDDEFRVEEYLALYPELFAIFGTNLSGALMHWLNEGSIEGRLGRVPLVFSAQGYFDRNLDVAVAVGGNPLLAWQHYWAYGIYEGRAYDDELYVFEYLAVNADLTAAFVNDWRAAALHWMRYGKTEGRLGRVPLLFNVSEYLKRYPDVGAAWGTYPTTVFLHYWLYGINELKTFDEEFRVDEYLTLNPDLAAVFGTDRRGAFKHWVRYGRSEGRAGRFP